MDEARRIETTIGFCAGFISLCLVPALFAPYAADAATLQPGDIVVTDVGSGMLLQINPQTGVQTIISSGGHFFNPWGVAVEASRSVLVVDTDAFGGGVQRHGGVIRVDPSTGGQTVVSSGGFFKTPRGIALDGNGGILVVDRDAFNDDPGPGGACDDGGAVIRVDGTTGDQTVVSSLEHFCDPQGITVDDAGSIWIADHTGFNGGSGEGKFGGSLIRVDPVTGAQTVVSSGGEFFNLNGVATETSGSIIASREGSAGRSGELIRVDPSNGLQSIVATKFSSPHGIVFDNHETLLVADWFTTSAILSVDPVSGNTTTISSGGFLNLPTGIAVVLVPLPSAAATGVMAIMLLAAVRAVQERRRSSRHSADRTDGGR
jgi:sugar lactone lactonase YvrE